MNDTDAILNILIGKWEALDLDKCPPKEPVDLLTYEESVVYVEDNWGPAVPYPAIDRGNGQMNHGYRRIKGNNDLIDSIPEAANLPEYQAFLREINSVDSAVESVGCEKAVFRVKDHPTIKVNWGSYTDIIFSDLVLNNDPKNILYLASIFAEAMKGSAVWWSKAELGIQMLKALFEYRRPWGLLVRVQGYGRTEEEARMTWATSLNRLSESVKTIRAKPFGSL